MLGTTACARVQEDNVEQQRDAVSTGRVLETVVIRQTVVYRAEENTDGCTSVSIIRPCGTVHFVTPPRRKEHRF